MVFPDLMFYVSEGFLRDVGLADLPPAVKEQYRDAIRDRILDGSIARMLRMLPFDLAADYLEWKAERECENAVVVAWLQIRCPEFHQVIAEERRRVQADVAKAAPELMALEELTALESDTNSTSATRTSN